MFDQFKDLYNLQKQAKEMQKQLADEIITGSSPDNAVTITMNGNQEILSVKINNEGLSNQQLEAGFKQAFEDSQEKLKRLMMSKFKM
jgi:DNA-binding protein YbaB